VNSIFHFSCFDPDYPISGLTVTRSARVYCTFTPNFTLKIATQCDRVAKIQKFQNLGIIETCQRCSLLGNVTIKHISMVMDTPKMVEVQLSSAFSSRSATRRCRESLQPSNKMGGDRIQATAV
jgi:hypothetical protein